MRIAMKGISLSGILVFVAMLSVIAKMISGNNLFLVLFLVVVSYGIVKEEIEGKVVFLLFFSSWIYVLKLSESSFSLYHIIQFLYVLSCLFSIVIKKNRVSLKVILGFLTFSTYILINSGFNTKGNLLEVVGFLFNFLIIAFALLTIKNSNNSFKRYVIYYTTGLFCSGLVAFSGNWIPQVKQYIQNMAGNFTVHQNNHLYTRFSGLDLDPNYFSLQILFALSLLLVLSRYKKKHLKENVLILLLTLMGLNTLSKMFIIILLLIVIYTCFVYLRYRLKSVVNYTVALIVVLFAIIPLGLLDFINATLRRFVEQGNSVDSITTGRSELWSFYIEEILSNPRVFFVGNGIGSGLLDDNPAHNMYLSYWYFAGFIGVLALLVFIFLSISQIKSQSDHQFVMFGLNKLPLIVLILANFSLDSILMDFFPFLLFLSLVSMTYTNENRAENNSAERIKIP